MLRYNCADLTAATQVSLDALQKRVNECDTRFNKYERASALFASKSTKAWDEVRAKLAAAAPPGDACFYCERDRYRDIDHVRPKRHYPEESFVWANYVYSCTICNQDAKRDTYAVFDANGTVVAFDRSLAWTAPVPVGDKVLIDPRTEDPLEFLHLDLSTGRFVPIGTARSKLRGQYTRELFKLNDSALARIRVHAYDAFRNYLSQHRQAVLKADQAEAARALGEIRLMAHPTVLVEMRRQKDQIAGLDVLFELAPADIGARP
jgi:uncharacterized protein (TIGR02646 family)